VTAISFNKSKSLFCIKPFNFTVVHEKTPKI
jgi:hypothetical protein